MTIAATSNTKELLVWDWDIEHDDRKRETRMDKAVHHAQPFQVDRRVLKEVVQDKLGMEVSRIVFLNAGKSFRCLFFVLFLTPSDRHIPQSTRQPRLLAPFTILMTFQGVSNYSRGWLRGCRPGSTSVHAQNQNRI